jgi:Glycine zipper
MTTLKGSDAVRIRAVSTVILVSAALGACAVAPPRPRPFPRAVEVPVEAVPELAVYPGQGQSPAQLDRDRFECHDWAVKQTRFDPSAPRARSAMPPVRVAEPQPTGAGAVVGAITGAVLGSIVARPGSEGAGAAIGAVAGGLFGAAAEDSAQQDARASAQQQIDARAAARRATDNQGAGAYRRALSACLEGRGYTVR